jgi:molybdenum cofactor biosynthesis enzyme MoaA
MTYRQAISTLDTWCNDGLKNVRFSGGEPMLHQDLPALVDFCKNRGVERIAISTNGSFPLKKYLELVELGANDFSISFDACCAAECGKMCGAATKMFERICNSIRELSKVTYVTVGVVLTDDNADNLAGIVQMAHDLGVADIRIIPAAQNGDMVKGVQAIPESVLEAHPILNYRVKNMKSGMPVRGHCEHAADRCYIPIDDSVICGRYHFPCVIYMREKGEPIGLVGPNMREERIEWVKNHRPKSHPICSKNCLDVCIDHNNKCYDIENLKEKE